MADERLVEAAQRFYDREFYPRIGGYYDDLAPVEMASFAAEQVAAARREIADELDRLFKTLDSYDQWDAKIGEIVDRLRAEGEGR